LSFVALAIGAWAGVLDERLTISSPQDHPLRRLHLRFRRLHLAECQRAAELGLCGIQVEFVVDGVDVTAGVGVSFCLPADSQSAERKGRARELGKEEQVEVRFTLVAYERNMLFSVDIAG
jgi:hypothetical protein